MRRYASRRKVLVSIIVAAAAIVALGATTALADRPVDGQYGRPVAVERLPARCYANIYQGLTSLSVGVWTPQYPKYWDVTAPVGAWAIASGYATFTPNGSVIVTCFDSPVVHSEDVQWPSGPFIGSSNCQTARGGDEAGNGAKVYQGRALVITNGNGHVIIICHAAYAYTNINPIP